MAPQQLSWSSLPDELLSVIIQKLIDSDDILNCAVCAAVCSSWQSVVKDLYHQIRPNLPPLLLRNLNENCVNRQSCTFFNPKTKKFREIPLPEVKGRWVSCSSHGWLLTVSCLDETQNMFLLHPFTRSQVKLPPPPPGTQLQFLNGLRVITSTSPLDPDCLVLASLYVSSKLAFCKPGDRNWTSIVHDQYIRFTNTSARFYDGRNCCKVKSGRGIKRYRTPDPIAIHSFDVCRSRGPLFYKGYFYCLGSCNFIFRIRFDHPHAPTAEAMPFKPHEFCCNARYNYLVELNSDLFIVSRFLIPHKSYPCELTCAFIVCKLDLETEKWIMVNNIGNNAVLLGENNSTTCVVSSDGEDNYFGANCIYFVDDMYPRDIGVYYMTSQCIQRPRRPLPLWTTSTSLNWLQV